MTSYLNFSLQITETYAFLPREAVTRFLMGCIDCQRRPRSLSPSSVLPTPSPSPTPLPPTVIPNGFHQLSSALKLTESQHNTKNGLTEVVTKNWESEIDASQHSIKYNLSPDNTKSKYNCETNGVDLTSKAVPINFNGITNYHLSPTSNKASLIESPASAFRSLRKESNFEYLKEEPPEKMAKLEEVTRNKMEEVEESTVIEDDSKCLRSKSTKQQAKLEKFKEDAEETCGIETKALEPTKHKHKPKSTSEKKPYNPLDVCNLTSKDPPKSRHSPKRRHLNPMYSPTRRSDVKAFPKPWSPSMHSMFSPHRLSAEGFSSTQFSGKGHFMDMEIDYSVPITTTYLKHMRHLGYRHEDLTKFEKKVSLLIKLLATRLSHLQLLL